MSIEAVRMKWQAAELEWKEAVLSGLAGEPELFEAYCKAADAYFREKVAVRREQMLAEKAAQ